VSVCARCPKALGVSCCEAGPRGLATLTHADIERISEHSGRPAKHFVDEEWLTLEEAADYEALRPLYRGYFAQGPKRLTLKTRGRGCVFLGAEGCSLPAAIRPRACALYPFERLADGSWSIRPPRYGALEDARTAGDGCLAVEEAAELDGLLAAFALRLEDLDRIAAVLREEVIAHTRESLR
jgi:Fe-S-cluster containining protein